MFIGLKIYDSQLRRNRKQLFEKYSAFFEYCERSLKCDFSYWGPYSKVTVAGFTKISDETVRKELLKYIDKKDKLVIHD